MTIVTFINMSEKERSEILATARVLTDSLNLQIIEFLRRNKKPASVKEIGEDLDVCDDQALAVVQLHVMNLAERGFLRGYHRYDGESKEVRKKYGPMMAKIKETLQNFSRIVDSSIHPT